MKLPAILLLALMPLILSTAASAAQEAPAVSPGDSPGTSEVFWDPGSIKAPREYRPFRLMVGAAMMAEQTTYNYQSYYGSQEGLGTTRIGGAASLALFLSRRSAVNFFVGMQESIYSDYSSGYPNPSRRLHPYAGLELELMPIHLSLFGFEDLFEAGILLGATTLRKTEGNVASALGGVRVNFNFGNDFTLTGAARGNRVFLMGEAGLGFRI